MYTASKHGVIGLSKTAAVEYAADGIRVNVICPGAIDTPMLRNSLNGDEALASVAKERLSLIGRFGEAAEIAYAARWLCSDEAAYVIGVSLPVTLGISRARWQTGRIRNYLPARAPSVGQPD